MTTSKSNLSSNKKKLLLNEMKSDEKKIKLKPPNPTLPAVASSNRLKAYSKPRENLSLSHSELPVPLPTPKSPCFVHSCIDQTLSISEIINRCDNELTEYSNLAETAVSVRELSKKLGQARIQGVMQTVMIVTKPGDVRSIKVTRELAMYLITNPRFGKGHGVTVYIDVTLKDVERFNYKGMLEESPLVKDYLKFWTNELCAERPEIFNLVLTLGGDGTVLYTSWLFQKIVPPVLPFHMGSLGFLTNFDINNYKKHLTNAMEKGIQVNLRMRFTCTVYRRVANPNTNIKAKRCAETGEIMMNRFMKDGGSWESVESTSHADAVRRYTQDKDLPCLITQPDKSFEVLNDLVVDRGSDPYMSMLELFGDEQHLTTVQADGLVVATPTGSTAYSVSAGGSLVHPAIPALLITPICPHTLSFRPMLLPDSMELRICVPYNSRSTAWASFDGRGRIELRQGDHIKVTPSKFPYPTVCHESQSRDWFNSISRCLRWNEREKQKSFVVVEEESSSGDEGEEEYYDFNDDDDVSTKVDETSEQELIESGDDQLQKTSNDVENVTGSVNSNKPSHRRTSSKTHHDYAFAYSGKDGSDSSSNNSNSGEEEEWRLVMRKSKKKK